MLQQSQAELDENAEQAKRMASSKKEKLVGPDEREVYDYALGEDGVSKVICTWNSLVNLSCTPNALTVETPEMVSLKCRLTGDLVLDWNRCTCRDVGMNTLQLGS